MPVNGSMSPFSRLPYPLRHYSWPRRNSYNLRAQLKTPTLERQLTRKQIDIIKQSPVWAEIKKLWKKPSLRQSPFVKIRERTASILQKINEDTIDQFQKQKRREAHQVTSGVALVKRDEAEKHTAFLLTDPTLSQDEKLKSLQSVFELNKKVDHATSYSDKRRTMGRIVAAAGVGKVSLQLLHSLLPELSDEVVGTLALASVTATQLLSFPVGKKLTGWLTDRKYPATSYPTLGPVPALKTILADVLKKKATAETGSVYFYEDGKKYASIATPQQEEKLRKIYKESQRALADQKKWPISAILKLNQLNNAVKSWLQSFQEIK